MPKIYLTNGAREILCKNSQTGKLNPRCNNRLGNGSWEVEVDDDVFAELERLAEATGDSHSDIVLALGSNEDKS